MTHVPEIARPSVASQGRGSPEQPLPSLPPEAVYAALNTRPEGLTETEAQEILARTGPNRLVEARGPSLFYRFLAQFTHLFALLLWAGSVLAFIAGMASFAIAIIAVIILNGVFGFFQEYRAERAVAALKRLLPPTATVIRSGEERQIPADALVPGDVLVLHEGDRISADGRLVQAEDLRTDDSSLTGEAHPVHKTERAESEFERSLVHARNMVFAGSTVTSGSGIAVVSATGMATEFGHIAHLTQTVRVDPSPLQVEVGRVAERVALLSLVMGVGFFLIGFLFAGLSLKNGVIFGIGIVLGNVPEGLLPTMTLALAMGVQRMARRNAIVKRLASVETLGACTVICTDKTGTITTNQMMVCALWANGQRISVTGAGYEPVGEFLLDGAPVELTDHKEFVTLLRIGQLCNAARLHRPTQSDDQWQVLGDPTEGALLVAAAKAGLDRSQELQQRPLIRSLAFDPTRKRMSTIHRDDTKGGALVAYVKGAPRELLDHCSQALLSGQVVPLTKDVADAAMEENDRMARAGLRVLAMAYRELSPQDGIRVSDLGPGDVEQELIFVGLAGLQDPPRPEVPAAVEKCHAAGIRIIMITGDYGLTAASIAQQVGILDDDSFTLVDGSQLDAMSDEDLKRTLSLKSVLFARTTPEHKLRIVEQLRAIGEVVAVTGDGVNDAPALKRADIGVAMGRSGTDVAREAADMVLRDDNFATIVSAVEEGRAIFDNMRKFIVYIFAHLSPEAIPFIFFALFHIPLPLTVMQILAIDLGTETLPALALGVEQPEPDVMARPPRREHHLLGMGALVRGYGFLGLLTSTVVLSVFFLFLLSNGWVWGQSQAPTHRIGLEATTIVFLGIVLMQVGNAFACRTERASAFTLGLFSNRFLLWGIAFELAFAAAIIYTPFLQPLFGTAAIQPHWWLLLLAGVPVIFLAEELRKAAARHAKVCP